MYKFTHFIDSTEVDHNLNIKLSAIFALFQKASTDHSEILDIGKKETLDKGMYWVITRYDVEIFRHPTYLENIIIETYAVEYNKFVFNRKYRILDKKGNVLVQGISVWCVLSKSNHSVVMDPFKGKKIKIDKSPVNMETPIKIEPKVSDKQEIRRVRYTDLDLNGHVNNTKYIDYIVDIHDKEFYSNHLISRIIINYNKELMMGDEFIVTHDDKEEEHVSMIRDGVSINEAIITYKTK